MRYPGGAGRLIIAQRCRSAGEAVKQLPAASPPKPASDLSGSLGSLSENPRRASCRRSRRNCCTNDCRHSASRRSTPMAARKRFRSPRPRAGVRHTGAAVDSYGRQRHRSRLPGRPLRNRKYSGRPGGRWLPSEQSPARHQVSTPPASSSDSATNHRSRPRKRPRHLRRRLRQPKKRRWRRKSRLP